MTKTIAVAIAFFFAMPSLPSVAQSYKLARPSVYCSQQVGPGAVQSYDCTSIVFVMDEQTSTYFSCEMKAFFDVSGAGKVANQNQSAACSSKEVVYAGSQVSDFVTVSGQPPLPTKFGGQHYATWIIDKSGSILGCIDVFASGVSSFVHLCAQATPPP